VRHIELVPAIGEFVPRIRLLAVVSWLLGSESQELKHPHSAAMGE